MSLVVAVGCIDDLFQQLLTLQIGVIVQMESNEAKPVYGFFGASSYLYIKQPTVFKMFRFLIIIRFTMISVLKFYNCFDLAGSRIIKYWLKRLK